MSRNEDTQEQPPQSIAPFEITVRSDEMAVRDALAEFTNALTPLQLDTEEYGTVELVLAEVLNNIVEHAHAEGDGDICIKCHHQKDGLAVQITDDGKPMPDGRLPLGNMAALDVELEDMPEGGFGWFLIQHLAKDVTYVRDGDQNRLSMRLAIGIQR